MREKFEEILASGLAALATFLGVALLVFLGSLRRFSGNFQDDWAGIVVPPVVAGLIAAGIVFIRGLYRGDRR